MATTATCPHCDRSDARIGADGVRISGRAAMMFACVFAVALPFFIVLFQQDDVKRLVNKVCAYIERLMAPAKTPEPDPAPTPQPKKPIQERQKPSKKKVEATSATKIVVVTYRAKFAIGEPLRLREGPEPHSAVLFTVRNSDAVLMSEGQSHWIPYRGNVGEMMVKVRYEGTVGWVPFRLLDVQ